MIEMEPCRERFNPSTSKYSEGGEAVRAWAEISVKRVIIWDTVETIEYAIVVYA